jgi:NTE family protein
MKRTIENVVFSGAGVKGEGYAGVIMALHELQEAQKKINSSSPWAHSASISQRSAPINLDIKRYGGSSVGAIVATVMAVGISADRALAIIKSINIEHFVEDRFIDRLRNISTNQGLHSGEPLREFIRQILKEATGNPDLTFGMLNELRQSALKNGNPTEFKELYVTACDTEAKGGATAVVFNAYNAPDLNIADAVRMSASFPGFFTPYINPLNGHKHIDGGTEANYPGRIFDNQFFIDGGDPSIEAYNKATLGFAMVENDFLKNPDRYKISELALAPIERVKDNDKLTIIKEAEAIFTLAVNNPQRDDLVSQLDRFVLIPSEGVNTLDFNLSDSKRDELIKAGYDSTMARLQDGQQATPISFAKRVRDDSKEDFKESREHVSLLRDGSSNFSEKAKTQKDRCIIL